MNMLDITAELGTYLNERTDVAQWVLQGSDSSRREIYLVGEKIEQLRAVEEIEYQITVYCDVEEQGDLKRGFSRIILTEAEVLDKPILSSLVDDAVYSASLALNPHYELAEYKPCDKETAGFDYEAAKNLTATVEDIAQRTIKACRLQRNVFLASSEAFFSHRTIVQRNSNGLVDENETTLFTYELALGSIVDSDVETHLLLKERLLKNLQIEELIKKYADYCRDNTEAIMPPSGTVNVIFADESFESLFTYFQVQASAGARYMKMTNNEPGAKLIPDSKGDKLTLAFDPYLDGGISAQRYDEYGTMLEKHTIIKDGVLAKESADQRFGTYLESKKITGGATNIVVSSGKTTYEKMVKEGDLILYRFSAFMPNNVTGDFSAEIRNGHLVKDGQLVPIKGGSISGNLKEVMKNALFSVETFHYGRYFGPKYVRVSNVTSSGQ